MQKLTVGKKVKMDPAKGSWTEEAKRWRGVILSVVSSHRGGSRGKNAIIECDDGKIRERSMWVLAIDAADCKAVSSGVQ